MSIIAIRAALEQQLNAMSPALPTAWENTSFTPEVDMPYQRVNIIYATPDNPEMSAGYRELGYMQVTLCYPQGVGSADAAARAIMLRNTFPKNLSLTNAGVVVTVDATPAIASGMVDADRWQIPVRIPFHANLFS